MDFGKLFKRSKSVKEKRKVERFNRNRHSERTAPNDNATSSSSSSQRNGISSAVNGNRAVNRWSGSSQESHESTSQPPPLPPRKATANESSSGYKKRKSSPALFSHQNQLQHRVPNPLPKSPLADDRQYRSVETLLSDSSTPDIAALVVSQNVEPPSYQDIMPAPQVPAYNSVSQDDLLHPVQPQQDSDTSWDSDSDDSEEQPAARMRDEAIAIPKMKTHTRSLSNIEQNKADDEVIDGVRRFRFGSRKSRKDNHRKEESPTSADNSRVHMEFRSAKASRSGPRLKEAPPHLEQHQIQRRHIIETILNSECSYIESLERLELHYRKALLDARPQIISPDTVDKIFYKIEEILECHRLFQIALAAVVEDWDVHEEIGNTFVACFSKSMVLECYSKYINNFTTAIELVGKNSRQKPQFDTFLQRRQAEGKDRLSLLGLMLKPVQRFPQFIMLVQDLLKNTPSSHVDSLPLQLALTELETLAGNLDRCRAESEEKSDMVKLINSSNIRLTSPFTKGGHHRRLLKKESLRELAFDESGTIEKDKETFIILTSDLLISCSGPNRRQQGLSTFRDLYKLRWCTSLADLDIQYHEDSSASIEIAKINNDIVMLKTIGDMIRKLQSSCPLLTIDNVNASIHSLTAKAEECSKNALQSGATSLTVSFPHKEDRRERRTLVMHNVHSRNEWRDCIANAKLSIDPNNVMSWFTSSNLEPYNLWSPPLFLQSMACEDQKEVLQVQCIHTFVTSNQITSVWLAFSSSNIAATVNIYDMQDQKLKKTRSMHVVSSVQCMECWNPFSTSLSVWLGMEGGSLHEYGTEFPHPRICQVTIPTMSTVMLLKAIESRLYVGLLDDTIEVYARNEGSKSLERIQSIGGGSGRLISLSPFNNMLWAAAGNDIITINPQTLKIESTRKILSEKRETVTHAAFVGSGLWVAFAGGCSLHLYHRGTLEQLQDLDLSTPIRDFLRDYGWHTSTKEQCNITSLWSAYHHLMAGTSNGLVLVMPLPKLPGSVPKTTGPCRICYHTLRSPVCFLRTSNVESYDLARQSFLDATRPESSDSPIVSPNFTHHNPVGRTFSANGPAVRKLSDAGSPKLPDRRSRLGSVFGELHKDELPGEEFTSKRASVSMSNQLAAQVYQSSGNTFPIMIACGDRYKYVNSRNSDDTTDDRSTVILSWKMVL